MIERSAFLLRILCLVRMQSTDLSCKLAKKDPSAAPFTAGFASFTLFFDRLASKLLATTHSERSIILGHKFLRFWKGKDWNHAESDVLVVPSRVPALGGRLFVADDGHVHGNWRWR